MLVRPHMSSPTFECILYSSQFANARLTISFLLLFSMDNVIVVSLGFYHPRDIDNVVVVVA